MIKIYEYENNDRDDQMLKIYERGKNLNYVTFIYIKV